MTDGIPTFEELRLKQSEALVAFHHAQRCKVIELIKAAVEDCRAYAVLTGSLYGRMDTLLRHELETKGYQIKSVTKHSFNGQSTEMHLIFPVKPVASPPLVKQAD